MLRRLLTEVIEQVMQPPGEPSPWGPIRREEVRRLADVQPRQRQEPAADEDERAEPRRARPAPVVSPPTRRGIAADLSSPGALRRAFILTEILGPPVSLRDPTDRFRTG